MYLWAAMTHRMHTKSVRKNELFNGIQTVPVGKKFCLKKMGKKIFEFVLVDDSISAIKCKINGEREHSG